jgi:hypothetical protein
MSNLNESARPGPGTSPVPGPTSLPVTVALGQLPEFKPPATMRFRWAEQLLRGDVIEGLRDRWAVVARVTRSGPDVTIRVQEAGGSRTAAYGAQQQGFGVRSDIRVDPSTIPDIPDGFPPRWRVWHQGLVGEVTLAWHPEPGKAAEHARQASRDGDEYVVELEAPAGSLTQVDAYQRGRRSTWGKHLAERLSKTVMPQSDVESVPGLTRAQARRWAEAQPEDPYQAISVGNTSRRAELVASLRELADYLAANPAVPVPACGLTVTVSAAGTDEQKLAQLRLVSKALAAPSRTAERNGQHHAERAFGPVTYVFCVVRGEVLARHAALMSYQDHVDPGFTADLAPDHTAQQTGPQPC